MAQEVQEQMSVHLHCPDCAHEFDANVWTVIDVQLHPDLKEELVAGRLNMVACPDCGGEHFVPTPFVYHDATAEHLACFVPLEAGSEEERLQMAETLLLQVFSTLEPAFVESHDYLRHPYLFTRIESLRSLASPAEPREEEEMEGFYEALQALLAAETDEQLAAVLNRHPQLVTPEAVEHIRRLANLAAQRGREEAADYLEAVAAFLESLLEEGEEEEDDDPLQEALEALADAELPQGMMEVFLAHPILLDPSTVTLLRQRAAEARRLQDLENAQALENIAEFLEGMQRILAGDEEEAQ